MGQSSGLGGAAVIGLCSFFCLFCFVFKEVAELVGEFPKGAG